MKRRLSGAMLLTAVLACCLSAGCRRNEKTVSAEPTAEAVSLATGRTDSLLHARADSAVAAMSLDERIGMLLMPAVYTRSDDATLSSIVRYARDMHAGGLILLKGDTLSARIITDTLRAVGRDDMFVAIDAEWGLGMRLEDAPTYPVNRELGERATESSMRAYGHDVAAQCRRLGIGMVLGPVADVVPGGERSFLSRRSLGDNPRRVAALVAAYSHGLEDGGVVSVAKHFPGHGAVIADSHRSLGVVTKSLNAMQHTDLVPFQRYIDEGLSAIMIGHVAFPAIDIKRRSAAVSESVITELLRHDMGFEGLVLTDALNMGGAGGASAADAIAAGADMVLAPVSTPQAMADIRKALATGRLTARDIDDRCRRIMYYMLKFK